MSKHTPGPWHIPSHLSGADGIGPEDGYEIITCCCCGGVKGDSKEQEIANSRLIVAAPELLEALKRCLEVLKELQECSEYWSEYFVPLGIHDRIKNAIKAAEDIE